MAHVTELFGSALTANLPEDAQDVSVIRQVPNNQEVFTHPQTDQSLSIEMLEYVSASDDMAALHIHYKDLEETNEATNSQVFTTQIIPEENLTCTRWSSVLYLHARQSIAKFNEVVKNVVDLHLALFRLPQYTTDILITFNDPVNISVDSSSHVAVPTQSSRWTVDDFKKIISTFTIQDDSIFAT